MLYQNDNNTERDERDMHNQQTLPQQPSSWQQIRIIMFPIPRVRSRLCNPSSLHCHRHPHRLCERRPHYGLRVLVVLSC